MLCSLCLPHCASVWLMLALLLGLVALLVSVLLAVAFLTLLERKLMATLQLRLGPNLVGV